MQTLKKCGTYIRETINHIDLRSQDNAISLYGITCHSLKYIIQCSNPKSSVFLLEENMALCLYAEW